MTESIQYKSLHFAWFAGHAALTTTGLLYFLSAFLLHPSNFFYRLSLVAAIATYAITLVNAYKPTLDTLDMALKRMLLDENSQYLLLAVYFLCTKRITVALLPYVVYSVFHTIQCAQTHLLPSVSPQHAAKGEDVKKVLDRYHELTMHYVAQYELAIVFGRLVLGLFVFKSTLFSVLLYAHFIRMRYYLSSYMRDTFHRLAQHLDKLLLPPTAHKSVPPAVSNAYKTLRDLHELKKRE
ncbi:hypothetical protein BC940DRAFT_299052 [Gongronella butleri]|nr:hypothetical protein BC940DRAFT_299052 [Gongronella butleri]